VTGSSDTTGLVSNVIRRTLDIECAVLMGANYAPEVSIECFCEATIGRCRLVWRGSVTVERRTCDQ